MTSLYLCQAGEVYEVFEDFGDFFFSLPLAFLYAEIDVELAHPGPYKVSAAITDVVKTIKHPGIFGYGRPVTQI